MSETINVIMTDNTSKENKLYTIVNKLIVPAVIPLIIAIATLVYTHLEKNAEISLKYVELSINILNNKPINETKDLREWAVKILNKNAPLELNQSIEKSLINDITIANSDSMFDMIFKGRYNFYWDKNIKVIAYEIQKYKDGDWELFKAESILPTKNSFSSNLLPDTRLRWRVAVNTHSNLSSWQEIDNCKPSGNYDITSIIKAQMNN